MDDPEWDRDEGAGLGCASLASLMLVGACLWLLLLAGVWEVAAWVRGW